MTYEKRDLTDTVVAITGASSGIGYATAVDLLAAGAKVSLGARRTERTRELLEQYGDDRVQVHELDVTQEGSCDDFARRTSEQWGAIDSFVASAGIGVYGGVGEVDSDDVRAMVEVNVTGTIWSIRSALPALTQSRGDIVIIASVAGQRGGAHEPIYAATKFAQVGLAGAIDRELRPQGIRAIAICPAGVHTEFAIGKGRDADNPSLRDLLQPEDVAAQVRFVLEQPRRLRTTTWSVWSASEAS